MGRRELSDEDLSFITEPKTVFYAYTGTQRDSNIC